MVFFFVQRPSRCRYMYCSLICFFRCFYQSITVLIVSNVVVGFFDNTLHYITFYVYNRSYLYVFR